MTKMYIYTPKTNDGDIILRKYEDDKPVGQPCYIRPEGFGFRYPTPEEKPDKYNFICTISGKSAQEIERCFNYISLTENMKSIRESIDKRLEYTSELDGMEDVSAQKEIDEINKLLQIESKLKDKMAAVFPTVPDLRHAYDTLVPLTRTPAAEYSIDELDIHDETAEQIYHDLNYLEPDKELADAFKKVYEIIRKDMPEKAEYVKTYYDECMDDGYRNRQYQIPLYDIKRELLDSGRPVFDTYDYGDAEVEVNLEPFAHNNIRFTCQDKEDPELIYSVLLDKDKVLSSDWKEFIADLNEACYYSKSNVQGELEYEREQAQAAGSSGTTLSAGFSFLNTTPDKTEKSFADMKKDAEKTAEEYNSTHDCRKKQEPPEKGLVK